MTTIVAQPQSQQPMTGSTHKPPSGPASAPKTPKTKSGKAMRKNSSKLTNMSESLRSGLTASFSSILSSNGGESENGCSESGMGTQHRRRVGHSSMPVVVSGYDEVSCGSDSHGDLLDEWLEPDSGPSAAEEPPKEEHGVVEAKMFLSPTNQEMMQLTIPSNLISGPPLNPPSCPSSPAQPDEGCEDEKIPKEQNPRTREEGRKKKKEKTVPNESSKSREKEKSKSGASGSKRKKKKDSPMEALSRSDSFLSFSPDDAAPESSSANKNDKTSISCSAHTRSPSKMEKVLDRKKIAQKFRLWWADQKSDTPKQQDRLAPVQESDEPPASPKAKSEHFRLDPSFHQELAKLSRKSERAGSRSISTEDDDNVAGCDADDETVATTVLPKPDVNSVLARFEKTLKANQKAGVTADNFLNTIAKNHVRTPPPSPIKVKPPAVARRGRPSARQSAEEGTKEKIENQDEKESVKELCKSPVRRSRRRSCSTRRPAHGDQPAADNICRSVHRRSSSVGVAENRQRRSKSRQRSRTRTSTEDSNDISCDSAETSPRTPTKRSSGRTRPSRRSLRDSQSSLSYDEESPNPAQQPKSSEGSRPRRRSKSPTKKKKHSTTSSGRTKRRSKTASQSSRHAAEVAEIYSDELPLANGGEQDDDGKEDSTAEKDPGQEAAKTQNELLSVSCSALVSSSSPPVVQNARSLSESLRDIGITPAQLVKLQAVGFEIKERSVRPIGSRTVAVSGDA